MDELIKQPVYHYTLVSDIELAESLISTTCKPTHYGNEYLFTDIDQLIEGEHLTKEQAREWIASHAPVNSDSDI